MIKQMKLNADIIGKILSGAGFTINTSKVIDDSASEPTEGINPYLIDITKLKELIQKTPEGTKIISVSSDGTIQYTLEIDAKENLVNFDGLRLEGISSFNASQTNGGIQSEISILEDGSGVLIAREGNLEYYLTLKGANGFEIQKIEDGTEVEYLPSDNQIVIGKNLSDLKIEVNGKVEGINGVITLDGDTIYENGGVIKAKVGLTPEEGKLLFSNKVNYDTQTGSKAILNATNGNEMEFKVGELAQPSLLLEENGINMLNGRIIKTNTSDTNDSTLINKAEVKELIANAAIGDWINIYDNGNLVPADDGNNNYYYVFTPNSSNLDKFSQAGVKDYVAVPGVGVCFINKLNIPFYDFSVVGDFSDLYGADAGGIWLEDTLTLTVKDAEKFQNKEFIVYVKDKEPTTNIIYNKIVLKIDFNYLMTFTNGYAELQLNEQLNWIKTTYKNSTDKTPTVDQGTWITSDRDFRINRTDTLDVGSVELSDYLLKTEAEAKYLTKNDAEAKYLIKTDAEAKYLTKTEAEAKYEPKEVWEDITFSKDSNKIILDETVSLFSKIKMVGNIKFKEYGDFPSINSTVDVYEIPNTFYINCKSSSVIKIFRVRLTKTSNKIDFAEYDIRSDATNYTPTINDATEFKIQGIRK